MSATIYSFNATSLQGKGISMDAFEGETVL